jgi:hypothetical protein
MSIIEKLNAIHYKKIIWLLAVSETLHNIEEAIWLPGTSTTIVKWHYSVGTFEFRIAVLLLTVLIYGIILYFSKSESKTASFLMGGSLVIILFNVFIPHLVGSIINFSYAPGVISGIFFNIPTTYYLLWRGIKENYYNSKSLVLGGIVFLPISILLIQISLFVGRIILEFI